MISTLLALAFLAAIILLTRWDYRRVCAADDRRRARVSHPESWDWPAKGDRRGATIAGPADRERLPW